MAGIPKGNEYVLHEDFRVACRAMCETCMRFANSADSVAENIDAGEGVPAFHVSTLHGGANKSFLIECGGKKYVVKQTIHKNWENGIKRRVFGSESQRMIKSMRKATQSGCDAFQKTIYMFEFPFLLENRRCMAIWSVSEFIEGTVLSSLPNRRDFVGDVVAVLPEIARNGIFQTDFALSNFIIPKNGGIQVIDIRISNTPNLALLWKMAYKCRRSFGISMPTTGFGMMAKAVAFLGDKAFAAFEKPKPFE